MENRLQHNIIMWFSQKYPEYYGCLWATFNEDARHKKNVGMHAGVSDLMFFRNGIFAGIELKAPGRVFTRKHILRQLEWGRNIIYHGGYYYIGSDITEIKLFLQELILKGSSSIDSVTPILQHFAEGYKTIKF